MQSGVGRNLDCAKGGICRLATPHQYRYQNVSLFPLRPPPIRIFLWMGCRKAADLAKGPPSAAIFISILKSGSDIWPKGHLRLTFLRLKNLWAGVGGREAW